jgi:hypothetical protein
MIDAVEPYHADQDDRACLPRSYGALFTAKRPALPSEAAGAAIRAERKAERLAGIPKLSTCIQYSNMPRVLRLFQYLVNMIIFGIPLLTSHKQHSS